MSIPGRYYEDITTDGKFHAMFDTFDIGKSEVKPEHLDILNNRLIKVLDEAGFPPITIMGEASHTGSHAFNFQLARDRAYSIRHLLLGADYPDPDKIAMPEPDANWDLHEDDAVGEHKKLRRVIVEINEKDMPAGGIPVVFPFPPGFFTETD